MSKTFLLVLVLAISLQGQTKRESAEATPLPAHVVYGSFFSHLLALEDAAAEHDKAGRKGDEVRAYYQNAMKLSGAEAATMKADCHRVSSCRACAGCESEGDHRRLVGALSESSGS